LALIVDQLGFHNLLEGRIPKLFLRVWEDDITRRCLRRHAGHLCNGLIVRLLQISRRQWTFGNSTTVHLWGPDGRKSEDLLWTDTSTLLEDNRCLLDIDFTSLGDAPAATCQVWLSEVEAVRFAAREDDGDDSTEGSLSDMHIPALVDTEDCIHLRRRRRWQSGIIEHSACSISLMEEVTPYGPG
jgi:hypothetical protein